MLSSTSVSESAWSPEQYALAAALADVEHEECSGCGQPLSESTSLDSDPNNREGTHRYDATPPVRCHACTAIARRRDDYRETQHTEALRLWPVERYPRPERTPRG